MSVIINEFEIVVDDQQDTAPMDQAATTEPAQAPPPLASSEVRDIVRHQLARLERLWAH
jgi:hypothetical protein